MTDKLMTLLKSRGRYLVAFVSLTAAFVLSIQFGDRGGQFDLRNASVSASESSESTRELSDLKVLNKALLHIKDNYVEPERIDPTQMLTAALDEVQNVLPEVVVDYKGNREAPSKIGISVNEESKTFEIEKLESLWELSFSLREVFQFIEGNTQPPQDGTFHDVEYAAINGMLTTLDPHSTLLPPKHYKEMQTQTGGEFGGLGIVISIRDGKLTVISPIDGTPASRTGIKARDRIVRIGEESTINMSLHDAVSMLRGKPGSKIDIWVDRKGWSEPKKFTITRAVIQIKSVNSEALDDKVGYLRIKNFQANTTSDMKKHLKKLKKEMGGIQGLVLDMRDNPGGLLDQAIKISDLFLEKGTIVSTVGVGNKMKDKKTATKSGTEPDYPIVVLVNAGSASASEIVSAALQNNGRALVAGDTTFGKGTVQVLYEFSDSSALKLTIAQYLTPGGVSIQGRGITPDLRLIPANITKEQINMFLSENILREQDLQSHLSNKAAEVAKDQGVVFLRYLAEQQEQDEFQDPNAFNEDFQISLAQQMLKSVGNISSRTKLLKEVQPELEKVYSREMGHIQKKLGTVDIDWAAGPSPEGLDVDFEVTTQKVSEKDGEKDGEKKSGKEGGEKAEGQPVITAGESFKMTAKLTNNGEEPVYRVKAITRSATSVLDDREFIFGHLKPGESKSYTIDVSVPKDTPTRHDMVKFRISDEDKSYGDPRHRDIFIKGLQRPQFAFKYAIDDASGDGILQMDEEVTLEVAVENIGKASSAETLVYLKNLADEAIYLEKGRTKIDSIETGKSETVSFKFRVKEKPENGESVGLEVDVYDSTFGEYVQKKLQVPFSADGGETEPASGAATITKGPAKVYIGADTASDLAATVEKSATYPVVATAGDWLKVDLGERKGWVQKQYADFKSGKKVKASPVKAWNSFQAPTLKLTPAKHMTDAEKIAVEGLISDNTAVKDYYIFVYHREDTSKIESNKLDYKQVNSAEAKFSKEIPLFEGMNRVMITARDEEKMQIRENVYIYRK